MLNGNLVFLPFTANKRDNTHLFDFTSGYKNISLLLISSSLQHGDIIETQRETITPAEVENEVFSGCKMTF